MVYGVIHKPDYLTCMTTSADVFAVVKIITVILPQLKYGMYIIS